MNKSLFLALALSFAAASRAEDVDTYRDPLKVAADLYKLVFENERLRVLSFHAAPGAKWALHAHPDTIVISMSDYKVRNVVPGSEPVTRDAKKGAVLWIPARSHTGENVGTTDMDCILVELKESKEK
jgi:hypothetical protein